MDSLSKNVNILGEAISRYMYQLSSSEGEAQIVDILRDDMVGVCYNCGYCASPAVFAVHSVSYTLHTCIIVVYFKKYNIFLEVHNAS